MDALMLFFGLIDVQVVIAGMFGGAMRSVLNPKDAKISGVAINVFVGAVLAYYVGRPLAPHAASFLSWAIPDAASMQITVGFLFGAGGIAILGLFLDGIGDRIKAFIKRDPPPTPENPT